MWLTYFFGSEGIKRSDTGEGGGWQTLSVLLDVLVDVFGEREGRGGEAEVTTEIEDIVDFM